MTQPVLQNGLTDIDIWENKLGLFPSKLFSASEGQYILLNGSTNSFCIDLTNELEDKEYLSFSWSADVESFISFEGDNLILYRWFKQNQQRQIISKKEVKNNLNRFYDYLGESKYNIQDSIISFMMDLFRSVRSTLKDIEGTSGLKALLFLLAYAKDGADVNLNHWGLDNSGKDLLINYNPNIIEKFIEKLHFGIPYKELKPDINLILRHSSGRLFEEAHYEAYLSPQLNLWGLPESDIRILKHSKKLLTGVYFTPQFITRSIVEECLRLHSYEDAAIVTIFDPACGSGEFLKEAVRQLRQNNYNGAIHAIGWDISESAIDMAKFVMHYEKLQNNDDRLQMQFRIVEDSMKETWPEVDILLMNPPYLSWDLMNIDERNTVAEVLGNNYKGHPNMASAFLWKAVNSLREGAKLGCVIPSSIFIASSYQGLRNKIRDMITSKLIGKLGSYIFYNALVDASIYIGSKETDDNNSSIYLWSNNIYKAASDAVRSLRIFHKSAEQPIRNNNYSVYKSEIKTWSPLSFESITLSEKLNDLISLRNNIDNQDSILSNCAIVKIGDMFNVRQGVRTGKNDVFIVSKTYYSKLNKKEKEYFRPAVSNKSIKDGILSDLEYIWYPYGAKKLLSSENTLKNEVPKFYIERLKPNKISLQNRKEVEDGKYKWWDLTRERPWHDDNLKLVSTEFGKSGSFAIDISGNYIVQRGHAWLPKKEIDIDFYYTYLMFFNCKFFNELLKIYSKQIPGGEWWYLGNKHVCEIPIPNFLLNTNLEIVTILMEYGKNHSLGKLINNEKIYSLIKSLYGL